MKVPELGSLGEILNFDDHCKLGRKKFAESLTSIMGGFTEGGVIALNNQWGTGKTTFVHMWRNLLKSKSFETIYFNAWENDFEDNPLVAIIAELTNELKRDEDILIEKGEKLISNVFNTTSKIIVDRVLGDDSYNELKSIGDLSTDKYLNNEIKNYNEKKNAIKEFKTVLKDFIIDDSKKEGDNKVVFFIDELDRCRPNYAVKILEIIKHFFSVPNIIFVLSIDKEQLGHAICGVYGSDKIDTDEYLRRFIDIEYSLPTPNTVNYIQQTLNSSGTIKVLTERANKYMVEKIQDYIKFYFCSNTLRQIDKIVSHIKATLIAYNDFSDRFVNIYILLLYLKFNKYLDYRKLVDRRIDIEDFNEYFHNIYEGLPKLKNNLNQTLSLEAVLLNAYCNADESTSQANFAKICNGNTFIYQSLVDQQKFESHFHVEDVTFKLNYIINYIELVPSY